MDPNEALPSIEGSDDLSIPPPAAGRSILQSGIEGDVESGLEGESGLNIHPSPTRFNRFERLPSTRPFPLFNNTSITYPQSHLPATLPSLIMPSPELGPDHEGMDLDSSNFPREVSEPKEETQLRMDLDIEDASTTIKAELQSPPHHSSQEQQPTPEHHSSPQYPASPEPQQLPERQPTSATMLPPSAIIKLIDAQRQMLENYNTDTVMEDLDDNEDDPVNAHEADVINRDHLAVDAAMGDSENHQDQSWMHQAPDEDDEVQNLHHVRNIYEAKLKSGKITPSEKAELYRAQKRIAFLGRMKSAQASRILAHDPDEEPSLFVSDKPEEQIIEHHMRSRPDDTFVGDGSDIRNALADEEFPTTESDEEESPPLPSAPAPVTKKTPKKRARNAKEVIEQQKADREKSRTKDQRKKNQKGLVVKAQAKSQGKGKASKSGGKGSQNVKDSGSRYMIGRSGHDDISAQIIRGLATTDDISARRNNPIFEHAEGPEILGKQTKKNQFNELFANVPDGGEKSAVKNDKKALQQAAKGFGYAQVRAINGRWKVNGMKSNLYHHQLLGAQWMISRELGGVRPYGGLQADTMGLGKTVQTLACMVGNKPGDKDIKRGIVATLIVVPAAVLTQWMDEIQTHVEEDALGKVMIFKRSTQAQFTLRVLQTVDVVLTSYSEVMNQIPFPDNSEKTSCNRTGYQEWASDKEFGVLMKIHWYRVVLDEAHAIKNNSCRTSMACQQLNSVYRWCLTGTPLLNTVEELFPYLRFLKADYCMDMKEFKKYFCNPRDPKCSSRVATILNFSMLRRTMKSTLLNRPILKLPEPHPHVEKIDFSEEEQIIYRITEDRFRAILNTYIRKDDARHNYTLFMVQLLRLRQCTGHPFMMERTIKESWTPEDVEQLKERLKALGTRASLPFYERTKQWVTAKNIKKENRDNSAFGKGSFGSLFSLGKALGALSETQLSAQLQCGICEDVPTIPVQIQGACEHVFCETCFETREVTSGDVRICPICDLIFERIKYIQDSEIVDDESDLDSDTPSRASQRGKQNHRANNRVPEYSKGRDAMGFEMYTPFSTWLTQSDTDPSFPLTSSAKVTALKACLLKDFQAAPMDKIVIYCQFRQLQRIIGRMCNQEGWGFLYYTGDTSMEHRTKVGELFKNNPDIRIMIAGLKCGGLGLNLTAANRVYSMDLWWNFGVEQQAFGRIFRIGQEKETYMTRIVVKNSVDMRMLAKQKKKLKGLNPHINDEEPNEKQGLSIEELANLFGFLKKNAQGKVIEVVPDYDDEGEGGRLEMMDNRIRGGVGDGFGDGNGNGVRDGVEESWLRR